MDHLKICLFKCFIRTLFSFYLQMAWESDNEIAFCSAINLKEIMAFEFTNTHMHCIAAGLAMLELLHCRHLHLTHQIQHTHRDTALKRHSNIHTLSHFMCAAVIDSKPPLAQSCTACHNKYLSISLSQSISITPHKREAILC